MRLGLGNRLGSGNSIISNGLSISGFAYPNETLTAPAGTSYQWYVNDIARVTTQTMTPTVNDIGLVVRCVVDGVECEPVTMWHPQDIPSVQAFWWAAQGAYFTVANGVTDANASTLTDGLYGPRTILRAIGNDQNGKAAYGSGFGDVSSSWCYWNGSQWVLNTLYGEGANNLITSSSDTTYPWQATWSNVTVTREATIVNALAADGQAVTAWRDIISGVDVTADTNNIALFEADDLPTASLKFDGTDFFTIPFSLRGVFNGQDYGYIFAGVKDTAINELEQNPDHGVVSINRTGGFPKIALTTRRDFNSYFDAITGPNSSVLTTASLSPNNEDYNVLTNEAMWADGQIRLRVNGEQSEDVGSFEAVQPNNTVTNSYIGAYTSDTSNFVGYMTAIILATDLMSDTDRHRIERFIGLLGGLNVRPPNRAYDIDNIVLFEEASDAIPNNWTNSNSAAVASVSFNSTLTSIGSNAFGYCTSLTSVTIPNSVTSIGSYAFNSCMGLTNLTIGSGITSIGSSVFTVCTSLTSVTIPNSVTSIGTNAFSDCSSLTSVTIPNSVTSIGSDAFSYCSSLTSVTIPNSVTNLGSYVLASCIDLTSVTIGSGVTSIGSYAFYLCTSLTNVTIPNSVTSLGTNAFDSCTSLTNVTIGSGITSLGESLFYNCTNLTSVTIPNSVTSIGSYAFDHCTGLTGSLTIPNSVTSIGSGAFGYCSGLTGPLTIPNSVTTLGSSAFYYCSGFTGSLTIPDSVTSIPLAAFYGCSGFTGSLNIPSSVTQILSIFGSSYGAFENCSGFTTININASTAPFIDGGVFSGCTGVSPAVIHVPVGATGYSASYDGLTVVYDL